MSLKNACLNGDSKAIREFLSSGGNPNIMCDKYGSTLLHIVRSPEVAEELIKFNADIEAKDASGRTPLCCAVANSNHLKVVEVLLSNGANVNVKMKGGTTPLYLARNLELTNILLSHGAEVNVVDNFGRAPIHSALIDGKGFDIFKALLEAGADVNLTMGRFQNTLLHYADSLETTRELLLRGAKVNAVKIDGQTPLHCAVRHMKKTTVVRELLKWMAFIDIQDDEGETPLALAMRCYKKDYDAIKALLRHGANINFEMFDYNLIGYCTIIESALFSDFPCAKLLVKMFVLKYWNKSSAIIIDFNREIHLIKGKEILKYKDDCVSEIIQMMSDKMFLKYTLHELLSLTEDRVKPIYGSYREIENDLKNKYPIYYDVIMEEVEKGLERGRLVTRLEQFYTNLDFSNDIKQEIRLNSDCLLIIAKYLSDSDILNIVIALEEYFYNV